MPNEFTPEELEMLGYLHPHKLPNGEYVALERLIYTWGLCYKFHTVGYEYRWCYEKLEDALDAMKHWDGEGDPPGPWIAKRPK